MIHALVAALSLALPGGPAGPDRPSPPAPGHGSLAATSSASAFAAALAYDGERIYVGEPGEISLFPMPANRPGVVHVYARDAAGRWTVEWSGTPEGVAIGDRFGAALDGGGGALAVGAPGAKGGGVVYVLERGADGWATVARLTASDQPGSADAAGAAGSAGDEFGAAVSLEGEWLLVGAPGANDGAGAVHAFRRTADGWEPAGTADGEVAGGRFGAAVALDASGYAAVGAPGPMPPSFPSGTPPQVLPGAVHVIRVTQTGWETDVLEPAEPGPGMLGAALAVDGEVLYASQPLQGRVFRYERTADGWAATDTLTSPVQGMSGFGFALALAGDELLVAAPMAARSGGANAVHAFRRDDAGVWSRSELRGPDGSMLLFGLGVAAAGNEAVLGAPGADTFEGVALVFGRGEDGRWRERRPVLMAESAPSLAVTGEARPCAGGEAEGRPCEGVDLLAYLPVDALGGGRGVIVNDVWGWTDPETGREYALVGRSDGMAFVDITEPSSPRLVGELPRTAGSPPNLWRDVKTYADHAFVVADNAGEHGMQVFDLRRLREAGGSGHTVGGPGAGVAAGSAPVTFEPDATYDGIHSAHNIVIDPEAGLAAAVGASGGGRTCGGGLHMIDIRDPLNPTFLGCFADPTTGMGSGYSHDAQCVTYKGPDERYAGHRICLGSNGDALSIADVTDPADPVPLAAATYPNSAFLHQGWFSEDQRYFYMNDETDEIARLAPRTRTLVWDLAELDDPVLVREHLGTNAASDHNLYVRGDTMYQANYVSGLRMLDISDPENPREVGYFDTVPAGDDAPGFAGAWSVYPFFPSGTLIVTSMREGLFVLKARPRPVS